MTMRIVVLDSAPPASLYSGKSVRLVNLFTRLGRRHDVRYVAIVGRADAVRMPDWLRAVVPSSEVWTRAEAERWIGRVANWAALRPWFHARWRYPDDYTTLSRRLAALVAAERIDLIHCVDDEAAQFISDAPPCPWIMDPADAMALHAARRGQQAQALGERLHWQSIAWRLARYERDLVGRADASVFVSPVDAACYARGPRRAKVQVIPNGVETDYFSPRPGGAASQAPMLLFTGHMSFSPNHDAAMRLLDTILPAVRREIPEATACIAGADPRPELQARHDGRQVTVTGRVEDLRPWMDRAAVYVCPMRLGAGIKNKLLEAMAMAKAIVTTRRGADGLAAVDGEQMVFADSDAELAAATLGLLRDPAHGQRLGHAARALAVERYSWESVTASYERLYRRLTERCP